jgi:hypothetical protein
MLQSPIWLCGLTICCSVALALTGLAQDAEPRTWTIGGKEVEASFKAIENGNLTFLDAAGNEIFATFGDLPLEEKRAVVKASGWGHVWTDATGKHHTVAQIKVFAKNMVLLEKLDGSEVSVGIERLSAEDRAYIDEWNQAKLSREKERAAAKIEFDAAWDTLYQADKEHLAALHRANEAITASARAMVDSRIAKINGQPLDPQNEPLADQALEAAEKEVERTRIKYAEARRRFEIASDRYSDLLKADEGDDDEGESDSRVKIAEAKDHRKSAKQPMDDVHIYREAPSPLRWYEGGTLKDVSAVLWQDANAGDKLATCGFFVYQKWTDGKLKQSISTGISSVDELKPFAAELVDVLDAEYKLESLRDRLRLESELVRNGMDKAIESLGWLR